MNERIKQLCEQAKAYATENAKHFTGDEPVVWMDYYTEKFAQLIVEECLKDIETAAYHDSCEDWEWGYNSGLNKAKELIVSHFEVEE